MQFSPRLTSASVSPWVATTLPALTPTITPHPVPQKRHGAFDHLISSDPMPPATGCAAAGTAMPAAAAALAATCAFNKSRRESDLLQLPQSGGLSTRSNHKLDDQNPCADAH